jgi:hypothetical protein
VTFTVADRRVYRDGQPFTALGVNYHPARAGCDIWVDWDPGAIARDFTRIADAGLNAVRLFLFWRDFQPEPDTVSAEALHRLDTVLALAGEAELVCVVSLFTIWMNGQLLDLPWRAGRNPWRDPVLLDAQDRLARAAAGVLKGRDEVLAVDLGDELWNIDPAGAAALSRAEVAAWQGRLAGAVREEAPGTLVFQANDASGVFGSGPFGCDNADGLDLVATHGFPTWAPGSIESTMSYKATNLTSFLTRVAGAYGPPLVDELGSYGVGETTAAAYLGASAASALANGATGLFVWCWQDISATRDPYRERPLERAAGLHRLDGSRRPAMDAYAAVVAAAGDIAPPRPAPTALYLPQRMRGRGGTYLDSAGGAVGAFYAYLLAKRAHLEFDVTAHDLAGRRLVICPSVTHLTAVDLDRLTAYLDRGGMVYLSLGDHLHAYPGTELTGVELVDFGPPAGKSALCWDDDRWVLDWDTVATRPTTVRPTTARVLAHYPDGSAALVANQVGRGQLVFCTAPFEAALNAPGRLAEGDAHRFYRRLAALAGLAPVVPDGDPEVEIVLSGQRSAVVVNHGDRPARHPFRSAGAEVIEAAEVIEPKGWRIVELSQVQASAG